MMTNEDRADRGEDAVRGATERTRAWGIEDEATCVSDALAYVAHYCDRLGIDPYEAFPAALRSYEGDAEDGPPAARVEDLGASA